MATETILSLQIRDLRVVIMRDGELWFAQGVDVDYAASGVSIDDVKRRFANGLAKSLVANVEAHGNCDAFLRYPPQQELERLRRQEPKLYLLEGDVTCEEISEALPLPFNRIAFYAPAAA